MNNCDHSEDAGVICGAVCVNGTVRLMIDDTLDSNEDRYIIKDELARGRVEVCIGGRYGTICDDYWDYQDASVVCNELRFSSYGKLQSKSDMISMGNIGTLYCFRSHVECVLTIFLLQ